MFFFTNPQKSREVTTLPPPTFLFTFRSSPEIRAPQVNLIGRAEKKPVNDNRTTANASLSPTRASEEIRLSHLTNHRGGFTVPEKTFLPKENQIISSRTDALAKLLCFFEKKRRKK